MACLTARVILSCLLRCSLPIRPDPPHTRSASRDLLALETTGPPISPFLISPSTQAFPFHTNTEGGGAQRAPPPASPAKVQLLGGGNEPAAQANDGGYAAARAKFRSATVAPPSALLARVAAFLPQLASANARLDAAISVGGEAARQKVSIEHVEDEDKQHIEMNIDVGVLEMQKDSDLGDTPEIIIPGVSSSSLTAAAAAASSGSAGFAVQSVSSSDEDDDEDEDEDASDDEEGAPRMGRNGNTRMRSTPSSTASTPAVKSSAAPSSSSLSRAARKKKKYRERTRDRAATAEMDTGETTDQQQQQQQRNHPLIEEMED